MEIEEDLNNYLDKTTGTSVSLLFKRYRSGFYSAKYVKHRVNRNVYNCLLYTSPSPRDKRQSRMPSSA